MIRSAAEGGCLTLTLDRPDKANALTEEMLRALLDAVQTHSPDTRALILTGAGAAFSAGADLQAARAGLATSPVWEELSGAIAALPCLTIAALNGTAAGGALGMVFACDLRVALPGAKLFYPVMQLGFLPQPSDPARIAAVAGPARAKLLLMAGAKLAAPEALALGLIDVLSDTPLETARALANDALGASADHVAAIKAMVPRGA